MALFGLIKKDPNAKLSGSERMQVLGATLRDVGASLNGGEASALSQLQAMLAAGAQRNAKTAFGNKLAGMMGPQYQESPAPQIGANGVLQNGDYRLPTRTSDGLSINSPELMGLAVEAGRVGYDMRDIMDIVKARQPHVVFGPDNVAYDDKDPRIAGRRVVSVDKGEVAGTDAMGNPTVGLAPGKADAAATLAGAVTGAQEGAKSAYDVIDVPDGRGGTIKMPRAAYLTAIGQGKAGGATGLGYTPPAAKLAGDKVYAEETARGEVGRQQAGLDRVAAAGKQLSALDEMEALLPDVIAGFGSDIRLQTARAMAAAGNEDAKRQVAATETFINQGRVLVASIIKTFGANPTEGERKFAEKMSGADAELNPQTLAEGIRLQRLRIARDLQEAGKPVTFGKPMVARDRLQRNEIYQTPKGPLRWTGTGFVQP